MLSPQHDLAAELAAAVEEYHRDSDGFLLAERLRDLAQHATSDAIIAAVEPYRDIPDVVAPLYERVVDEQPTNARAMVILANAWWLQGRGPEVVGELANRIIATDPGNRAGWHLWALTESDPRRRVARWRQVAERFPEDVLALANVADNAASVAGAEQDYEMLDVAVATYEQLLERTEDVAQRDAVDTALRALRGWKF